MLFISKKIKSSLLLLLITHFLACFPTGKTPINNFYAGDKNPQNTWSFYLFATVSLGSLIYLYRENNRLKKDMKELRESCTLGIQSMNRKVDENAVKIQSARENLQKINTQVNEMSDSLVIARSILDTLKDQTSTLYSDVQGIKIDIQNAQETMWVKTDKIMDALGSPTSSTRSSSTSSPLKSLLSIKTRYPKYVPASRSPAPPLLP